MTFGPESRKRVVAVVTGTRAEYGVLAPVIRRLQAHPACALKLLVTGTHLSEFFGHTIDEIRADGFPIAAEIPCLSEGDDDLSIVGAVSAAMSGLATAYRDHAVEIVLVMGDRFEALAAGLAAFFLRIPVAHVNGGEATEALLDEGIRHTLTKLASLHFVAVEPYAARVRAMGEPPDRVRVVGDLAIDVVRETPLFSRTDTMARLGVRDVPPLAIVTHHPVTLHPGANAAEVTELAQALTRGRLGSVVWTYPNADHEGRAAIPTMNRFVACHSNAVARTSLGRALYLSALGIADVMVGNSSSGIIEAPGFALPVVNIGARQQGRLRHANIIDAEPNCDAIGAAIRRALSPEFRGGLVGQHNRFGDGKTADRICAALVEEPIPPLVKVFNNPPAFWSALSAIGLRVGA